jgi:hypothetical protein
MAKQQQDVNLSSAEGGMETLRVEIKIVARYVGWLASWGGTLDNIGSENGQLGSFGLGKKYDHESIKFIQIHFVHQVSAPYKALGSSKS